MKRNLASGLLPLIFCLLVAPAWAGGDPPSCHNTAIQPPASPSNPMVDVVLDSERVEFFSTCNEKKNIASYCTHLTTTIRKRDPGNNVVIKYFVADKGPCKDKDSVQAFCKIWTTYEGLKLLIDEEQGYDDPFDPEMKMPSDVLERSAKLCGMSREALLAKFCSAPAAGKSTKDWDLTVKACPKEGKEFFMHKCVGSVYQNMVATPKQCEEQYSRIAKKL